MSLREGLLLVCVSAVSGISILQGQVVSPIPGSLQDVAGQFPMPAGVSFEQQIQTGTQAVTSGGNPFAHWHAVQIRPWLHYDGIPNTTLTASASYISYFYIPGTSN